MTHECGDDIQIAVAVHVAKGHAPRLSGSGFRAKAGQSVNGLSGGADLRRFVGEASQTIVQIYDILSALPRRAVARYDDIQMAIVVHISQGQALGLRPAKTAVIPGVRRARLECALVEAGVAVVQVDRVLPVISADGDIQMAVAVHVAQGDAARLHRLRPKRDGFGEIALPIVQVDGALLPDIPDDQVEVAVRVQIAGRQCRRPIGAFPEASHRLQHRIATGRRAIQKPAGSVVQIDEVLLSIVADGDIQVAVIIEVARDEGARRIAPCAEPGGSAEVGSACVNERWHEGESAAHQEDPKGSVFCRWMDERHSGFS